MPRNPPANSSWKSNVTKCVNMIYGFSLAWQRHNGWIAAMPESCSTAELVKLDCLLKLIRKFDLDAILLLSFVYLNSWNYLVWHSRSWLDFQLFLESKFAMWNRSLTIFIAEKKSAITSSMLGRVTYLTNHIKACLIHCHKWMGRPVIRLWCEARSAGSKNSWESSPRRNNTYTILHEIIQEMAKLHVYAPLKLLHAILQ